MNISQIYDLLSKCNFKICTDTRQVVYDSLFIALKGEKFNANLFIDEALSKGCKYAIGEEYHGKDNRVFLVEDSLACLQNLARFHRKQMKAKVLAVAGSNGKTTTKELIASVLKQKFQIIYTQGNFNNHIGVPLTILSIRPDTEFAVVEMGANHLNELEPLCNIADPDYGIVTNVGKEHLEGFGSFEGVVKTETYLYRYLEKKDGLIFINNDNDLLVKEIGNCKTSSYGKNKNADIYLSAIDNNPFLKIHCVVKDTEYRIQTKLVGSYNWENILAAISIGNFFGVPIDKIIEAIEAYYPSNHRSQWIEKGTNKIIMDAYNANPTSMQYAIENFASLPLNNKILILGDMLELGAYEKAEHQSIIELLQKYTFTGVFLVGKVFSRLASNQFKTFADVESLKNYLTLNPVEHSTILIKGSHGIHLEKLLEWFSDEK